MTDCRCQRLHGDVRQSDPGQRSVLSVARPWRGVLQQDMCRTWGALQEVHWLVQGLGWVGSRPHPGLRDHGHRPSLNGGARRAHHPSDRSLRLVQGGGGVMRTHDPRSGGAQGLDGRYNAWRSGAPGPHAHENAARQVVDDRRAAEVRGQQKPSNDPRNTQHNRGAPTTGHR